MNIGNAIKILRKNANLSQKDFALKLNITQAYLSQIENNHKVPNLAIIEQIGKQMGIPVAVIMFLSINLNDVDDDKKQLFETLSPTIIKLIEDIFVD